MSKKDYIAIAAILRRNNTKLQICMELAQYFKQENPNFNEEKFIEACYVK